MPLLAVPNISEGRDAELIAELKAVVAAAGVRVLDVHTDPVHNRSVFTLTAGTDRLVEGCVALAEVASKRIDLMAHRGVHPRLGALDICPFVPHEVTMEEAVGAARRAAEAIAAGSILPVYLYGHAANRPVTRELPDLRRGGLETLARRAAAELPPDHGPAEIEMSRGVVCVGARDPLIAFNVWLRGGLEAVKEIAEQIRSTHLRALGLRISETESQVSMNLIRPEAVGLEDAFAAVNREAAERRLEVTATEIVGLVPERFLPGPDATVTRLLKQPGHSLEACLEATG